MNDVKIKYYINQWGLDLSSGMIIHQQTGETKRLGEYQVKLLAVLQQHAGKILSREELTTQVWERRVIGNNSLPNAIHALRVALEDDGKQQRVIKTIPRKGYILDADYCMPVKQPQSAKENPPTPNSDGDEMLIDAPGDADNQENTLSASEETPAPSSQDTDSGVQHSTILSHCLLLSFGGIGLLLLFLVAGSLSWWGRSTATNPPLLTREKLQNLYSNIHIYSLSRQTNSSDDDNPVYTSFKETFYLINQRLIAAHVQMRVYYRPSSSTLNMTLWFKSTCQEKQLVMILYHWRLNKNQLNNLIYKEIERKLDEMAPCAT